MTVGDGSDLTGDQRALRDTLRGFLVAELPTAALRATLETDAATARSCTRGWPPNSAWPG